MRPLCEGAGFLDHEHQLEGPGRVVAAVAGLPERLLSGGWSGQGIVERPCLDVTHAVGRRRGLEAPGRRQKLDSHLSLQACPGLYTTHPAVCDFSILRVSPQGMQFSASRELLTGQFDC